MCVCEREREREKKEREKDRLTYAGAFVLGGNALCDRQHASRYAVYLFSRNSVYLLRRYSVYLLY